MSVPCPWYVMSGAFARGHRRGSERGHRCGQDDVLHACMEGDVEHAGHGRLHPACRVSRSLLPPLPTPARLPLAQSASLYVGVAGASGSLASAAFSASRRHVARRDVARRHVVLAPLASCAAKHDVVLPSLHVHWAQTYVMHRKLFEIHTPYQKLCVYDSPSLGRVLALDGSRPPPP